MIDVDIHCRLCKQAAILVSVSTRLSRYLLSSGGGGIAMTAAGPTTQPSPLLYLIHHIHSRAHKATQETSAVEGEWQKILLQDTLRHSRPHHGSSAPLMDRGVSNVCRSAVWAGQVTLDNNLLIQYAYAHPSRSIGTVGPILIYFDCGVKTFCFDNIR